MLSQRRLTAIEAAKSLLYEAAFGMRDWADALIAMAQSTGGETAALFPYDPVRDAQLPMASTLSPEIAEEYLSKQRHLDPWVIAHAGKLPIAGASLSEQILEDRAVTKTAFYNEFGRRAGIRRLLSVTTPVATANSKALSVLSIIKGATTQQFSSEDFVAAQLLSNHIKGAVTMHIPIRERSISTVAALIDGGEPSALVARYNGILYANESFVSLAQGSAAMRLVNNQVSFRHYPFEASINVFLRDVTALQ